MRTYPRPLRHRHRRHTAIQFLDTIEPSLPFRSHRAIYSHSPTFIERSNITGSFGDNQQAFWLTAAQNDWSLGEQQRYFRQSDATSSRRYWAGNNVNVGWIPGQVSMEYGANFLVFDVLRGHRVLRRSPRTPPGSANTSVVPVG